MPKSMPSLSNDLNAASPKEIYTYQLLKLYEKYWDAMSSGENFNRDVGTALLLAYCPDRKTRENLWRLYTEEKKKTGETNACVLVVGDFVSYMATTLGLLESSTGGF